MPTKNGTVTTPSTELSASRRAEIIADLNWNLAYMVDLHVSAKQAHWNVHGPSFQGLHALFDTIAAESREYADTVAERVLALRGTAHGTIADVGGQRAIGPFPTDEQRWERLTELMHERLARASEQMKRSAAKLEDELGTQDVYVEIIRGLDKWAWMLEAHLGHR